MNTIVYKTDNRIYSIAQGTIFNIITYNGKEYEKDILIYIYN